MAAGLLLGLDLVFAESAAKRAVKAREDIKKAEPEQKTLQAKALTERAKAQAKNAKIDAAIRANRAAEAEAQNGKAAMIAAAEADVALRLAELTAAKITRDAANDDLAVQSALVSVWHDDLDADAVDLQSALAAWTGTETSPQATALSNALKALLASVTGMSIQLGSEPAAAGDDMAIHLNLLIVLRTRLEGAVVAYSVARAALPVGDAAPALALAAAGGVMLATIAGLGLQLEEFASVSQVAQTHQLAVDIAQEEYDGAKAVLDGLSGPEGSGLGALKKAVSEREAQTRRAENAKAQSAQADFTQAMRQRLAG